MATMNLAMPDELRAALRKLRPLLGMHSDAAAVRLVLAEACKAHGIQLPADLDVVGALPGTYARPKKKAARRKPGKPSR